MDPRETQDRLEHKRRESHAGHQHFEALYSDKVVRDLRKRHIDSLLSDKEPRLSVAESMAFLLGGNQEHIQRLREIGVDLFERHNRIKNGQADYLVEACSDARIPRLDSEDDKLVGVFVRIAGNVVARPGTAASDKMRKAVQSVKKDGLIVVEGHDGGPGCGAVNERRKWVEGGMKPTGSEHLDALLHEVVGTSPDQNAVAQLVKARETLDLEHRVSGAVVYNWEHEGIQRVSVSRSPILEILVDNWNHRHAEAREEGNLDQRLKKHRPHAIAVGTHDLPFSLATIFHAKQNEIFSTTGSEDGLDDLDKASILYAVDHLGVKHIPFIAPGTEKDELRIRKMFDRWLGELRNLDVNGDHVLARMLDSGELKINRLRYDLNNGRLEEM